MNIRYLFFSMALLLSSCANSQQQDARLVGGPCEGCEAVFEFGDRELTSTDTLPGFEEATEKLKITGTIYEPDGKTPAEDVIFYIHHTDEKGVYPKRGDEEGWARRHGYLRGWVKTDKDGNFTFYTRVPGTYPDRSEPAHIHPFILEPDGTYYYLNSYFFEDDPLLRKEDRELEPRGGSSGVVSRETENGMTVIRRDFVLGKNIPGY